MTIKEEVLKLANSGDAFKRMINSGEFIYRKSSDLAKLIVMMQETTIDVTIHFCQEQQDKQVEELKKVILEWMKKSDKDFTTKNFDTAELYFMIDKIFKVKK